MPVDRSDLSISTDKTLLNIPLIIGFVRNSYWGKEYLPEQIKKSIEDSICFGLYKKDNQVGFARVVTENANTAWLYDVFILPPYQRLGYGEYLLEYVLNHQQLKNITIWSLKTKDAHEFYQKFGFERVKDSERLMQKLSAKQ